MIPSKTLPIVRDPSVIDTLMVSSRNFSSSLTELGSEFISKPARFTSSAMIEKGCGSTWNIRENDQRTNASKKAARKDDLQNYLQCDFREAAEGPETLKIKVRPAGLEPATPCLEVRSAQISQEPKISKDIKPSDSSQLAWAYRGL